MNQTKNFLKITHFWVIVVPYGCKSSNFIFVVFSNGIQKHILSLIDKLIIASVTHNYPGQKLKNIELRGSLAPRFFDM